MGQLMMQNFLPAARISRHESSHATSETSNPIDWDMMDAFRLDECIEGKKLEIHWETGQ